MKAKRWIVRGHNTQEAASLATGTTPETLEVIKEKKTDEAPTAAGAKGGEKAAEKGGEKAAEKAPAAKGKK